jgi:dTDP-4-dehydrorhamnose reductase
VFDGQRSPPASYAETDLPAPVNVYGASKLAGEHLVAQACPRALIVRTASLFGGRGARGKGGNFVTAILARARAGEVLRVVDDVWMTPTYAPDAARALVGLLVAGVTGTVHVANSGPCTWYAFARRALALAGIDAVIEPVPASAYPMRARRPANSALDTTQAARLLGGPLRPWEDALADYVAVLTGRAG